MTTDEFIGQQFQEKYKDIWPVIRLILYRMDVLGKSGIFTLDGVPGPTSFAHQLIEPLRPVIYSFRKVFLPLIPKEDSIWLSETILCSNRYLEMLRSLYEEYPIVAAFSKSDINRRFITKNDSLSRKIRSSKRMYFGYSVSGTQVKERVSETYDLFVELRKRGITCNSASAQVDACLRALQQAVDQRVNEICIQVKKANVKVFITSNQYNLRDLLSIMACRKIGAWTKELSHYSNCVVSLTAEESDDNLFFSDNSHHFSFVQETCLWSDAEKEYCRKYRKNQTEKMVYSVVGCPEVTEQDFFRNTSVYEKKNVITLFVPAEDSFANYFINDELSTFSEQQVHEMLTFRENLYQQVAKFAKANQFKVYVRYHPLDKKEYIPVEKKIFDQLGFELLSESREDFIKAVCESKVVMGCMTTAFIISLIYGCKCYTLRLNDEDQYDFCGLNIHEISVNDIPNISLQAAKDVSSIPYLDIRALCEYPDRH